MRTMTKYAICSSRRNNLIIPVMRLPRNHKNTSIIFGVCWEWKQHYFSDWVSDWQRVVIPIRLWLSVLRCTLHVWTITLCCLRLFGFIRKKLKGVQPKRIRITDQEALHVCSPAVRYFILLDWQVRLMKGLNAQLIHSDIFHLCFWMFNLHTQFIDHSTVYLSQMGLVYPMFNINPSLWKQLFNLASTFLPLATESPLYVLLVESFGRRGRTRQWPGR